MALPLAPAAALSRPGCPWLRIGPKISTLNLSCTRFFLALAMAEEVAGDGAEAAERILASRGHFATLGLPEAQVDAANLRKQYRRLALAVHPDKCTHPQAKEAFQKLSEAFEVLCTEAGQRQALAEKGQRTGKRRRSTQDAKAPWWDTTWEEFEKRFRQRDANEAARQAEFEGGMKERSVEHLDRSKKRGPNALWPRRSGDRPELSEPGAARLRLTELLGYLRRSHCYCLYCGCVFESASDLARNCPGVTEMEHERTAPQAAESSVSSEVAESTGTIMQREPDPLDAFMSGMEAQLSQDMQKSMKATKYRHMPQKGWSFQQQAQQNKNELKQGSREGPADVAADPHELLRQRRPPVGLPVDVASPRLLLQVPLLPSLRAQDLDRIPALRSSGQRSPYSFGGQRRDLLGDYEKFREFIAGKDYWDNRYKKEEGKNFDWLGDYEKFREFIESATASLDGGPRSAKVLDLGCGNAKLAEEMYDDGFENITALDISEVAIESMRQRNFEERPNIDWVVGDAFDLQLEDESFDLVIDKSTP
ncbi:Methyltransferase-like protein 13 [Symbiodinium microadriaticum]|uniref:Methyltransferase-like protein 13 n=1 Tax=Symbiodinium microadriaticum TaxID=2951 RepID=A0A1Q9CFC8_SYMMI|nr:Methyltransferase-like protein 13 [Symbiodinium microadriaticum]